VRLFSFLSSVISSCRRSKHFVFSVKGDLPVIIFTRFIVSCAHYCFSLFFHNPQRDVPTSWQTVTAIGWAHHILLPRPARVGGVEQRGGYKGEERKEAKHRGGRHPVAPPSADAIAVRRAQVIEATS
jgi:hypothetical protein